jgi:hypothetical protein
VVQINYRYQNVSSVILMKQKKSNKGVKLNLLADSIKDTFKTGGIFPLLAAIPELIAASAPLLQKQLY